MGQTAAHRPGRKWGSERSCSGLDGVRPATPNPTPHSVSVSQGCPLVATVQQPRWGSPGRPPLSLWRTRWASGTAAETVPGNRAGSTGCAPRQAVDEGLPPPCSANSGSSLCTHDVTRHEIKLSGTLSPPRGGGGGRIFSTAKSAGPRLTQGPDHFLAVKEENNLKLPLPSPPHFPQPVRFLKAPRKEKKIKKKKNKTLGIFGGSPCNPCAPTLQAGAPGGAPQGCPGTKPCAGMGMLAILPRRVSGESLGSRAPAFSESPRSLQRQQPVWLDPGLPGAPGLSGGLTKSGATGALPASAPRAISAGTT